MDLDSVLFSSEPWNKLMREYLKEDTMSDKYVVKVNVFSGATLEEAAGKADNLKLEHPALFNASHVVRDGDVFKIVIITTQY